MIEHSSKSKGYLPMKSGPNMMGFDMGKSGSLMEMMQVGGQPSRGAAMLARSSQRRADIRKLEDEQRAEAKRQKRGGLFGSIGGIAGGLLGSAALGALGVATGGLALPLAAGIGTALGRRAGEGIGAGKTRKVDTEGTVFGQQDFRDVEQASRDYTRGMGERAIVSGLKSGLTAGLTPGGGIYGKARDVGAKFGAAQLAKSVPIADTGLLNIRELETPGIDIQRPVFDPLTGSRVGGTDVVSQTQRVFDPSTGSSIGYLPDMQFATEGALGTSRSGFVPQFTLDGSPPVLNTNSLLSQFSAPSGGSGISFSDAFRQARESGADQFMYGGNPYSTELGMEDGGLIAYQNGGSVNVQNILQDAGITATPQQLALFESFDPTELTQATEAISDSLLGMTSGQGLASAGTGFGARTSAIGETVARGQESLEQQRQAQQKAFESQTLGQAASMVDQGAEFGAFGAPPPTVSTLPTADQGPVTFNGVGYVWDNDSGQYITQDQFEQGMSTYYDDMYD
jgi:hypothetical protein